MGALAGVRVVEFAEGIAGPYCGRLLAGLGADVVKVEHPDGDISRLAGPFPGGIPDLEKSGRFLHLNAGKRSLTVADHLPLGEADILVDGSGMATSPGLRDFYQSLLDDMPSLVIVAVTPFGLSGPYLGFEANELVLYALSGYMSLTGAADRPPHKAYGDLLHYQAGAHAALGALAALRERDRSGLGQLVDVSVMEAGTFLLGGAEQQTHFFGRTVKRNGTRLVGFPPEHSYPSTLRPCRDGYVHAHTNNRHLDLLAALIPHERLLDPEVLGAMLGHADEIDAIMDDWLATRDRDEVVALAQELRLPFTEVRTPAEVLAEPHHAERGSFVTVAHPIAGPTLQPNGPIRMSATPWETRPAPTLGGDSGTVDWQPRRRTVAGTDARTRPLEGVRVIDFTNAVAGPIATSILGHLGADVIKVEAPAARPRNAAGTAPLLLGAEDHPWDRMLLYNCYNHGKRGVVLDTGNPAGRDVFLKLVANADVVVQNFAPRVMPNLGLAYEDLARVNPRVILVSMPAFGLSGPLRDRVSYGPGIDAMSGLSHLTGHADGPPMKPGNFFCDQNAAVHAAFATLAALHHRDATGEGQHVELPMIEGEFQILAEAYMAVAMGQPEPFRQGNDAPPAAPHDVYPSLGEDSWVAIGVETDEQFTALCRVIGRTDLAEDPLFANVINRFLNREELRGPISAWTSQRTHVEAMHALQAAGIPAGAVLDVAELMADPHVRAREGFQWVETPGVGPTPYPRVAFTLSRTPVPLKGPAPAFGGANREVFRDVADLSEAEIEALYADGVTCDVPRGGGSH